MVIFAGLHVMSHDFSGQFRSAGGRVIQKISVKYFIFKQNLKARKVKEADLRVFALCISKY